MQIWLIGYSVETFSETDSEGPDKVLNLFKNDRYFKDDFHPNYRTKGTSKRYILGLLVFSLTRILSDSIK